MTAVPPPVPPEIVDKATHALKAALWGPYGVQPPDSYAAAAVIAEVYGDIVEAARRDALTEAAEAINAAVRRHADDRVGMYVVGADFDAARILADLLTATAPRTAPTASVSDQGADPRTPTTPGAQIGVQTMTEPTADDLARWAALAEQATPGPWETKWVGPEFVVATPDDYGHQGSNHVAEWTYCVSDWEQNECDTRDAEFIAAARTAVPRLLALVAAQADQIAVVRALCDDNSPAFNPGGRTAQEMVEFERTNMAYVEGWDDAVDLLKQAVLAALDGTEATP